MKSIKKKHFGLLVATAIFFSMCFLPSSVIAADEIEHANSIKEYIKESPVEIEEEITIDKKTGKTNENSFKDIFGSSFQTEDQITDIIASSDEYQITEETKDDITVISKFATKRILVTGKLSSLYGASEGIEYSGETLLTYKTEEEAKEGYEQLIKVYGENKVFIDLPLITQAKGWGTSFMGLDSKSSELSASGSKVVCAVLDTGINKSHKVFSGKTITSSSYNILSGNTNYTDDNGHGTMTAGIISESTPDNVQIMALKVMNDRGIGSMITYSQAIEYAVSNGADILNCSLGGQVDSQTARYMDRYLKSAEDAGVITVAASGNDGADMDKTNYYPCESPYAICVGAMDQFGNWPDFSNYGQSVDFTAPGVSVEVADYKSSNSYWGYSGTSFSCPYIAAASALLKLENSSISRSNVVSKLANISVDVGNSGKDKYFGYGYPKFIKSEPTTTTTTTKPTSTTTTPTTTKPTTTTNPTTTKPTTTTTTPTTSYDINSYPLSLSYTTATYTGKAITPSVTLSGLVKGRDYSVSYSNNVNAGTGTITIKGIGNFTGKRTKTFTITKRKAIPTIALSSTLFAYDGSIKAPQVTVKVDGSNISSTYYTITRPNSIQPGTYKISVQLKGNYQGSNTTTYEIAKKPAKPSVNVKWQKSGSKYKIKATWASVPTASLYQLEIKSIKKNKKGVKYSRVLTTKTSSYTITKKFSKKQRKNSTVKIRVRAKNKVGYGSWSAWETVK